MGLAVRILRETLADTQPRARKPLGVVHLRLLGLDEESWTICIARPHCTVAPGAPAQADLRVYCGKQQLDALIEGQAGMRPLRYDGSAEVLDHLAELLSVGRQMLSFRAKHAAYHHAAHFREELEK